MGRLDSDSQRTYLFIATISRCFRRNKSGNGCYLSRFPHYHILLFVRNWPRPLKPTGGQMLLAAAVLIFSLLQSNWLAPALGAMAKPVMVYICAITVMAVTSILAGFSRRFVWIGAMLFVLSDSMIAAGRFKSPVPLAEYLIWGTYYLGQYCIAIGFLREKLGEL